MLESFFITGDLPANVERGVYQLPLVVLSFVVASFASYTAFLLAQQVVNARTRHEKRLLHWSGAFAMGAGIWSMHFIGMLSYKMRMVIEYDPFLTLCSMLIAVAFAYGVLEVVARPKLSPIQIVLGAILLGLGICSMHYTGMAAMKMDGDLRYVPDLFFLSVAIAIVASGAALWMAFTLARHSSIHDDYYQTSAALIMGAAICGMHYTGMAASVIIPYADCRYDPNQNFDALALTIAAITSIILATAFFRGSNERKQNAITKALLASIVESSDDAIISKTLEGIITSWNKGAEQLFGYDANEAVGNHISLVIPHDRLSEESEIISNLRQGKRIYHYETIRRRKDGRLISVSLTVSPIKDINGITIGASKIVHDITERREAENKLLRYTEALERSNQELDDFAYIASHDLKEPLRGMHNHASFLLEDYQDKLGEDGARRLHRMMDLAKRMEQLISDLLYFSQLGRSDLAVQDVDPNIVIEDIRQMLESFMHERNASIVIPKPLPHVVCDKPRVTEVFRNLITNAIKYNEKPEKRVEVGFVDRMNTNDGEKTNVFYVKDNGIGIEPQFHGEIFRIFKRLGHKDAESGTGVGLTFVKKIIERHQGDIWLESELGKGTTFFFTLSGD